MDAENERKPLIQEDASSGEIVEIINSFQITETLSLKAMTSGSERVQKAF